MGTASLHLSPQPPAAACAALLDGQASSCHGMFQPCLMVLTHDHHCRDAESRPDGWIPLVVAENKLGNAAMLERMSAVQDYPTLVLNYSG